MNLYLSIVFFSYLILCKLANASRFFKVFAAIFVLLSFALRYNVEVSSNLDYEGYLLWDNSSLEFNLTTLFTEPYFYLLSNFFFRFTHSLTEALSCVYYINFIIATSFFVWLASKEDVLLWKKVLLFTFYYFLFTYTTLRNGPAYILMGCMFYFQQRNKKFFAGYFSFLAHTSSLPAIVATFLKYKKPTVKFLIIIILLSLSIATIMQLPMFQHISNKYEAYGDAEVKKGTPSSHQIFFVSIILINVYLFIYNKLYVYKNMYIFMLILYVYMYFVNPVMAFRFSVFIIMFLCLHPRISKVKTIDIILNGISGIFLVGFLYGFYSNHK